MSITLVGPESEKQHKLREWIEGQRSQNIEQLDDSAKTMIQLVTGLLALLFAMLGLSDTPAYLGSGVVRGLSSGSIASLFISLLAALSAVVVMRKYSGQAHDLTTMKKQYDAIKKRKWWSLRVALITFVLGIAQLGLVTCWVLWTSEESASGKPSAVSAPSHRASKICP